ncbi:hypothetical protein CLOM_g17865 [Closterium sp. NIES-68]|nr:hypothetical protein CLOM_g17865 [Closterium sp. NIES-68]GJP78412.1 hypothetical protein CLOP_g8711 [Closterium sp. NIES-67]
MIGDGSAAAVAAAADHLVESLHSAAPDAAASLATGPTPALVALVSLAVLVSSLALFLLRHRTASSLNARQVPAAAGPGAGGKYQPLARGLEAAGVASEGEERTSGACEAEGEEGKAAIGVLFGTQTGTAEGFAKTLVSELQHHFAPHCTVELNSLDDLAADSEGFTARLKAFHAAFFLVATYGDGEPTDDAQRFFKWLHAAAASAEAQDATADNPLPLEGLRFAVFGLGNRQYEHFNLMGKSLDKHLAALGGQRVAEVGLGDDDQCIEDDFKAWRTGVCKGFEQLVLRRGGGGDDQGGEGAAEGEWEEEEEEVREYWVQYHGRGGEGADGRENGEVNGRENGEVNGRENGEVNGGEKGANGVQEQMSMGEAIAAVGWHSHTIARARLAAVRELQAPHSDRSTLHVELDLSECPGLHYEVGDHVAVFPENSEADVAAVARCLGVDLDDVISLHLPSPSSSLPPPPPGHHTIRAVLASLPDLHSSPRKAALSVLARCAADPKEAERLKHLASDQGKADYLQWVLAAHRSLLEVLQAFPSARPPLAVFLASMAPRLQPRFYSISSHPRHAPSSLHITCAVVRDVTPAGRTHHGVCSSHLHRHLPLLAHPSSPSSPPSPPVRVPVFIRSSHFRPPADPSRPIVMVGPGTGLAPFRAFLQHRALLLKGGESLGEALLFFGCRHHDQDYIYREELAAYAESGVLSALHVAFSRDGPSKVYVQHLLKQEAARVWQLIREEGGSVYVCGDAKAMARDVHHALVDMAVAQGNMAEEEAVSLLDSLVEQGRYLRDIW